MLSGHRAQASGTPAAGACVQFSSAYFYNHLQPGTAIGCGTSRGVGVKVMSRQCLCHGTVLHVTVICALR
jgi:2-keto-4-pentenoate hydratase/2-oxohepta-3-ene-1,7-dioic acid hydratase in catechol pathway